MLMQQIVWVLIKITTCVGKVHISMHIAHGAQYYNEYNVDMHRGLLQYINM